MTNRLEVNRLRPNWTPDQLRFVETVADAWGQGCTLDQVAARTAMGRGRMQYQLLKLGVALARGGRLVWTATGEPVDTANLAACLTT